MHPPLRYQVSEYDCGPTSVMNAISFLFATREVPPEFVKSIYGYTLDDFNDLGAPCRRGTSNDSLRYLTSWFNRYRERTGYPLRCEFYEKEEFSLDENSPLIQCLKGGGAAVVRCILKVPHYITLTGIDEKYFHVFDPYYWDIQFEEDGIIRVEDKPMEMNRLISRDLLSCTAGEHYVLCREEKSAMLFYKEGEGKVVLT